MAGEDGKSYLGNEGGEMGHRWQEGQFTSMLIQGHVNSDLTPSTWEFKVLRTGRYRVCLYLLSSVL
jgi:hypothetical protein